MLNLLFHSHVPPSRQDSLLADIGRWPEVREAAQLNSRTDDPALRRICFVILHPGHSQEEVAGRLAALPEVETAEPPALRWLG